MHQVASLLRDFFRRDVALLISGSMLCAAYLYVFGHLEPIVEAMHQIPIAILGLGVAYSIGYANQSLFEIVGLVRTTPRRRMSRLDRWVYYRLTGKRWKEISDDLDLTSYWVGMEEDAKRLCERTIALKMIGTAIGPAFLVVAVLLGGKLVARGQSSGFDFSLVLATLLVGMILIEIGRVKAAQQSALYLEYGAPQAPE